MRHADRNDRNLTLIVHQEILDGLGSVFSSFKSLRSIVFISKDSSDFLHDEEITNLLAETWHKSCPSLEIVSFPDSIWYVVLSPSIITRNDVYHFQGAELTAWVGHVGRARTNLVCKRT